MTETSLTRLYAAHTAQFTDDLPFWRGLAESSGGPILELGCGPGRVLLELAREGWTVTGLDNDEEMLQWVRSQSPKELLKKITLIQADMRDFHLPQQYPLVIVPCNTFAYLDNADALGTLKCVQRHLARRGHLAIAVPNPAQYPAQEGECAESEPISDFIEPLSGHPVQVYAYEAFDTNKNILEVLWAFDELFPDGHVKRHHLPVRYYLRSPDEMFELLEAAQLDVKHSFGDYQCSPLDQNSQELIIVAVNTIEN
jgi:SAM-dependent methyltransferase